MAADDRPRVPRAVWLLSLGLVFFALLLSYHFLFGKATSESARPADRPQPGTIPIEARADVCASPPPDTSARSRAAASAAEAAEPLAMLPPLPEHPPSQAAENPDAGREPVDFPAAHDASASAPPQTAGPALQPVYNVLLSPQALAVPAAPEMPVLIAEQTTTLRFDLGPPRDGSVLTRRLALPSAALLMSDVNVPLDIVLACDFCAPGMDTLRHTNYHPSARRAPEVSFAITPSSRAVGGKGRLELGIINGQSGREYDRLVVEVLVASSGPSAAATLLSSPRKADGETSALQRPVREPPTVSSLPASDVTLYALWQPDHGLVLSMRPHGEKMRALLPNALDEGGQPRRYSVDITEDMIQQITREDFGLMSALSRQGDIGKRLGAQGLGAPLSSGATESLRLAPEEREGVSRLVANLGSQLYRKLFGRGGPDLTALGKQLDAAASMRDDGKPLRFTIVSNRGSLPWQYLYPEKVTPSDNIDGAAFWGMRYSLSVIREDTGAAAALSPPESEGPAHLLLARYENKVEGSDAILSELSRRQRSMILELPVAEQFLLDSRDRSTLLEALQENRHEITALVFFLHADSTQQDRSPYLTFGNGDQVSSTQLEQLWNSEEAGAEMRERYWSRGPIVFLNACETGPSMDLAHLRLDATMFQLGARGVIVTEAPVWAHLGHQMAMRLIPRLARGETVPDALTASRRELYLEHGNPLGVLYAYYGDPAATLIYP